MILAAQVEGSQDPDDALVCHLDFFVEWVCQPANMVRVFSFGAHSKHSEIRRPEGQKAQVIGGVDPTLVPETHGHSGGADFFPLEFDHRAVRDLGTSRRGESRRSKPKSRR